MCAIRRRRGRRHALDDERAASDSDHARVIHATILIRVQASAHKTELASIRDGILVVRVAAHPHDGQANAALCRFLADRVGVRASRVSIVRGHRTRDKLIQIEDLEQAIVDQRLGL